jgi:hypothetical protein
LEEAIRLNPFHPLPYLYKGQVLEEKGEIASAINAYRRFISLETPEYHSFREPVLERLEELNKKLNGKP